MKTITIERVTREYDFSRVPPENVETVHYTITEDECEPVSSTVEVGESINV